jgi:hypothetical protein
MVDDIDQLCSDIWDQGDSSCIQMSVQSYGSSITLVSKLSDRVRPYQLALSSLQWSGEKKAGQGASWLLLSISRHTRARLVDAQPLKYSVGQPLCDMTVAPWRFGKIVRIPFR